MRLRPATFLVPGIFFLILGVGNFSVGAYKLIQYKEVLRELYSIKPSAALRHLSPLRRVQLANDTAYRLQLRRKQAIARRDLYRLVKFGGKIFIAFGVPLLLAGAMFRIRQRASESSNDPSPLSALQL